MELTTITRRVGEICGIDVSAIEPDPRFVGPAGWQGRDGEAALAREQEAAAASPQQPTPATGRTTDGTRRRPISSGPEPSEARRRPIDRTAYKTVRTLDELQAWIARALDAGDVAFDAQISSLDPLQADLIGVSLAIGPGRGLLRPDRPPHRAGRSLRRRRSRRRIRSRRRTRSRLLKPLMEAPGVLKIGHDVKFGMQVFAQRGVTVAPIDDTMLISYALDGG